MDSKEATPSEDTENAEKEAVKNITFLKQNLDFFFTYLTYGIFTVLFIHLLSILSSTC